MPGSKESPVTISSTIITAFAPLLESMVSLVTFIAVAWVTSHLPGPVRDIVVSSIQTKNLASINAAALSKASEMVLDPGQTPNVRGVIDYVEKTFPDAMAALQPLPEALVGIASKAILEAKAKAASTRPE